MIPYQMYKDLKELRKDKAKMIRAYKNTIKHYNRHLGQEIFGTMEILRRTPTGSDIARLKNEIEELKYDLKFLDLLAKDTRDQLREKSNNNGSN